MADFTRKYIQAVNGRFDVSGIEERLNIFVPITCLRGITWCAMAWVEYQEPGRLIRNEETFKKMEDYLNRDFLDMIEERYYKERFSGCGVIKSYVFPHTTHIE